MAAGCHVIHLALTAHGEETASARTMLEQARDACSAALMTARATRAGDRLWVVTRGAQSIAGDTADPIGATLWGLARSLAIELSDRWGGLVDLDRSAPPTDTQQLAAATGTVRGSQWALRAGAWFTPRLRPLATKPLGNTLALSRDSSYMVTGGLGAVGQRVVRWLIENGARHVAIVGRTSPRAPVLEALAAPGARVRFFDADVSDESSLGALIDALDPPLRGVVHSAGVYSATRHDRVSSVELESVMRPKVAGAWALHRATRDRRCDLFVLFSSAAAIWGAAGLAAYAAANSFLDALAAARRAAGLPATSIAWGRWPRGGMVSDAAAELFERIGLLEMDPDGALTAMRELLASGCNRAVIARVDWQTFAALHASRGAGALFAPELSPRAEGETGPSEPGLLRRLREAPRSERRGIMAQYVLGEIRGLLGFAADDPLDPTQGFFALGMDSVTSVRLVRRLEASLGRKLPPTLAFEHPTVQKLAAELIALTVPEAPARATACSNELEQFLRK
jgi:NADP-dependent 3-hydroxy acid dehydrogenase YdfG/acyl carrier protein